jgi:hypothetical protein
MTLQIAGPALVDISGRHILVQFLKYDSPFGCVLIFQLRSLRFTETINLSARQRNTVNARDTLLSLVDRCMNGLEAEDEFDDGYGCFDRGDAR